MTSSLKILLGRTETVFDASTDASTHVDVKPASRSSKNEPGRTHQCSSRQSAWIAPKRSVGHPDRWTIAATQHSHMRGVVSFYENPREPSANSLPLS